VIFIVGYSTRTEANKLCRAEFRIDAIAHFEKVVALNADGQSQDRCDAYSIFGGAAKRDETGLFDGRCGSRRP
jgi:hypothetical protein